jgi:DNA polymerase III subunit epsilon
MNNADREGLIAQNGDRPLDDRISARLSAGVLVNPQDRFDTVNVSIHRIRPEHVANAPTLREVLPMVASALATTVVVHHTHFDRMALCQAVAKYGFPEPTCRWLDSASVARRAWERFARRGYGLSDLAAEFDIEFKHHDACEDGDLACRC